MTNFLPLKGTGLHRFETGMANLASAYMDPMIEAKKQGKALIRPGDGDFQAVMGGFSEITDAMETVRVASVYISLTPPKTTRATKGAYLKLLVSALLHESYILEERLTAYATKMGRLYKDKGMGVAAEKLAQNSFVAIRRTRGSHVHQRRFSDAAVELR